MQKIIGLKIVLWQILMINLLHLSDSTNSTSFPNYFNISNENLSYLADQISEQYAIEYLGFLKTDNESFTLRALSHELLTQRSNKSWVYGFRNANAADKFLACTTCRTVVKAAEQVLLNRNGEWFGVDKEAYAECISLDICQYFNILPQAICEGYFNMYWPIFEYMLQSRRIDTRIFCNRLGIDFCNIKEPMHNWTLAINDDMRYAQKFKTAKTKYESGVKILQITDIHYDPDYKFGAVADCEGPLCCQNMPTTQSALLSNKLAGYWGDYRTCDAPLRMIESAFNNMRKMHPDIKYIYHNGDIVPHASWKMTKADIIETFTHMDKLMTEKFPRIPVYPCVGNNDVYPSDLSSPSDVNESVNTKWLYARFYWLWSKYLPPSTEATILKGGYYTVSPHNGFRIISLNSNECRLNNLWIYYNNSFAIEQLQWLHDTLLMAEQTQEHVHILAHTPISSAECWKPWSREYFRLIERFRHIISGIFYGHTHKNDMRLHYDNKGNAVNVAWIGGSLTSFAGRNPSYRVYAADAKTMQIFDHETWTFNLTAANLHGSSKNPMWLRLSRFTEDFTADLSPAGIDALLERMAANPELLQKYWLLKITGADTKLTQGCDNNCLQKTLCGSFNQPLRCRDLKAKLEKSLSLMKAASNGAVSHVAVKLCVFLFWLSIFCMFYKIYQFSF